MTQTQLQRPVLAGTDGFRGEFSQNDTPGEMNPITVFALSKALAETALGQADGRTILIGRDTRLCNDYLLPLAIRGAQSAGAEVVDIGVAPTPTTLYLTKKLGGVGAISLTASHNPSRDGGWKGTIGAEKPFGQDVKQISQRAWEILDDPSCVVYVREPRDGSRLIDSYVNELTAQITNEFGFQPLAGKRFVVDAAQGAAKNITPEVFRALGAEVDEYACDGTTAINEGCGATDLSGAQIYALAHGMHKDPDFMGIIANDGDADRIIGAFPYVDSSGNARLATIDGNRLLELMSESETGVVGTIYTNDASVDRIRSRGVDFDFCGNGDVEVTRKLRERGWQVGSEFSGHHVDLRWLSSGDGILKGAWLAAYAAKNNATLRDIAEAMPLKPQILHNFSLPKGTSLKQNDERLQELNQPSDEDVENGARSIARASGTEPLFRLCVQADSENYVRERLKMGRKIVAEVAGTTNIATSETRIA